MPRARFPFVALVCAGLAAGTGAAQESPELERLILRSAVPGLPDRAVDLTAKAARRYAIVVGNSDYEHVGDLRNAVSDARLVAEFLRRSGYEVVERRNLDKRGFEALLRRALVDIDRDTEVAFYYAGHGIQIGPKNYLIPVEAELDDPYDAPFETVALDSVIRLLAARARLQVVILDSCRDNPFEDSAAHVDLRGAPAQTRQGFSIQTAPVNTLLAFSTSPGAVAFDGDGENSPYTAALIETASASPDRPVSSLLEEVRKAVYRATGGRQVSWDSSTLVESLYFDPDRQFADRVALAPQVESGTVTRRVALATEAGAAIRPTGEAEAPAGENAVRIAARLDREISVGAVLSAAFGDVGALAATLAEPPESGRLAQRRGDGLRASVALGEPLRLDRLTYLADLAAVTPQGVRDRFQVAAAGELRDVLIDLTPDPCDVEAADHLDPGGVGLGVYANEIDPARALAACEAAVAREPNVGRHHYQLGRARLASGDFEGARASYEAARDLGHARAWYGLGFLIGQEAARAGGRTDAPFPEEALAHFAVGAEQGDPYAYYSLGRQLLLHSEDETLREQGFDLMMRALEVGHTFAMNELGRFFVDETNPDADPDRGVRYWRESAARGDLYGENNMGWAHLLGYGSLEPDPVAALDWFRKAAEAGHWEAPGNIARIHNSGELPGGPDHVEAVRWNDVGLARGDPWAGANAAWIIANRTPPGYGPFDAAARAAKAAAMRDAGAAEAANAVLDALGDRALDGGAQRLMAELGEQVAVDGAFGPSSRAALERLADRLGFAVPEGGPRERLDALALTYWRVTGLRVDLF